MRFLTLVKNRIFFEPLSEYVCFDYIPKFYRMITKEVIRDIYKNYSKPNPNRDELQLPYFKNLLKEHHNLSFDDDEIIFEDMDPYDPFRRILLRNVHAILEFTKLVAFVFPNHILFLGKNSKELRIHFKPEEEEKTSIFGKIFGKKK